ncbi:hypothetical protein CEV32_2793 [Brucella rhizosphaerae]|uniref:Uncharacterized protein n=1 Tax=Brucella rhizosphaerae TaxID=571254 RepID=A0A256EZQ4_9HYPH|nr:hypothetical protein CEV32_2793 [Brucella rhizosphaerae]
MSLLRRMMRYEKIERFPIGTALAHAGNPAWAFMLRPVRRVAL